MVDALPATGSETPIGAVQATIPKKKKAGATQALSSDPDCVQFLQRLMVAMQDPYSVGPENVAGIRQPERRKDVVDFIGHCSHNVDKDSLEFDLTGLARQHCAQQARAFSKCVRDSDDPPTQCLQEVQGFCNCLRARASDFFSAISQKHTARVNYLTGEYLRSF